MKKLLLIFIICISNTTLFSQSKESKYRSREVIVTVEDTVIRTTILTGEPTEIPKDDRKYFYYLKGTINSNIGDYGGKLLHGEYKAFVNNKLTESGHFDKGSKTGTWKRWYLNGNYKEILSWKRGILQGQYLKFNEHGEIIGKGHYKNGKYKAKRIKNVSKNKNSKTNSVKN